MGNNQSKKGTLGSRYFDLLDQFYAADGERANGFYFALRQLRGHDPEGDWVFVNNIFEAIIYGRKPAAMNPTVFEELRKRLRSSHDEYVNFFDLKHYTGDGDWNNPDSQLCQTFKNTQKHQFGFVDLPALAHFYCAGRLDEKSPAVEYLWEKIDLFVTQLTCYEITDISKMVLRTAKPRSKQNLVNLNRALETLRTEAEHHPLFEGFLEPFFRGVTRRFYQKAPLSNKEHPILFRYVHQSFPNAVQESSGTGPLGQTSGQDSVHLTFRDMLPNLVSDDVLKTDQVNNYNLFIKKLLLKWRFWAEVHHETKAAPAILEEERSFKALWSGLSHGVPQAHRDFAAKTKEICAEFFRRLAAKSPTYRPKLSIVQEIFRFDQTDSGTRWLYFSLGGCTDSSLASKPAQTPRPMPFSLFYTLYVDYKLSDRSEFINNYILSLPRESQRELLAQWFQRARSGLGEPLGLQKVTKLTFDKLLAGSRFPVSELETMPEIDPAMLAWSLAYLKFKKQTCPKIGYQKALAFLGFLLKSPMKLFFETYGAKLVVDLLPQLGQEGALKLGVVERLLKLAETYHNQELDKALGTAMAEGLFNLAPIGEKAKLKTYLDRQSREAQKPRSTARPKTQRSSRNERSIPF